MGGSIQGRVIDARTQAPVRKAIVTLSGQVRLVDETDADGKFRFTGLPAGTYKLSASRAGFLDRAAGRSFLIGANDPSKDAEIRLLPQSILTGRVLDEDGDPVGQASVMLFKQVYRNGTKLWDRFNTMSDRTNEIGEYRFPNLAPGHYILEAIDRRPAIDNQYGSPARHFNVPVYYPNATSQQQAVPVAVGAGTEVGGLDIHLVKVSLMPPVHVRGRLTGIPPESEAIFSVDLSPADGTGLGGSSTMAKPPDYIFEVRVAPGQYIIRGNVYSGGAEAYGSATLTVTGETDGVVLAIRPPPDIRSHITLAEDAKVNLKGVTLTLAALSSYMATGPFELSADAAGRFGPFPTLVRRPSHFTIVKVSALPDGYYVQDVKLGGQEISPDDFEIQSSADLEIVLSNKAARIAGSVMDTDSKPLPGATVTLVPADANSRPLKQVADDAGGFQFTNLRPGKYSLLAWEEVDEDLWQDPDFRKKYDSRATEITVGASEAQSVQVRAIPAEEIE